MRIDLLETLVCPWSAARFSIQVIDARGDEVEYAILASEAGVFPLVNGIPVLLPGRDESVRLLRSGDLLEARARALVADIAPARLDAALDALAGRDPVGRAAHQLGRAIEARRVHTARIACQRGTSADLIQLAYRDSPARSVDALNYFTYRWATPRHLVALSCIESLTRDRGPVLDLGCGAGHLTWPLMRRAGGAPVVGVDRLLFLLLAARARLGPPAQLVCADVSALPFRDGWASSVLASDVLSFVTAKWSVMREIDRVLSPEGWLALVSVINSRARHVYAGEPLTPAGWRRLVEHYPGHRVLADGQILARYLSGSGLDARHDSDDAVIDRSRRLTLVAARDGSVAQDHGAFESWPHAHGELGINPLYRVAHVGREGVAYDRRFPGSTFVADNCEMLEYLPAGAVVPRSVIESAPCGSDNAALDGLVASLVVLGFPPGSVDDLWGWSADSCAGPTRRARR